MAVALKGKKGLLGLGIALLLAAAAGCGGEGDITAPVLTLVPITSPTNQNPLTLTGTVEEGATVQVAVNPPPASIGAVEIDPEGNWNCLMTFGDAVFAVHAVSVTAADPRGNRAIARVSFVFDNVPPQVVAEGIATEAESSVVFVTFSEAMRQEAIESPGAMSLFAGDHEVLGAVVYDAAGRRAVFTPETELADGTYTIVLDAAEIRDLAGNKLVPNSDGETWQAAVTLPQPSDI